MSIYLALYHSFTNPGLVSLKDIIEVMIQQVNEARVPGNGAGLLAGERLCASNPGRLHGRQPSRTLPSAIFYGI
jgi:hypothetical protein